MKRGGSHEHLGRALQWHEGHVIQCLPLRVSPWQPLWHHTWHHSTIFQHFFFPKTVANTVSTEGRTWICSKRQISKRWSRWHSYNGIPLEWGQRECKPRLANAAAAQTLFCCTGDSSARDITHRTLAFASMGTSTQSSSAVQGCRCVLYCIFTTSFTSPLAWCDWQWQQSLSSLLCLPPVYSPPGTMKKPLALLAKHLPFPPTVSLRAGQPPIGPEVRHWHWDLQCLSPRFCG